MTSERKDTATWYLRMFSYLLVIFGLLGIATAAVVTYQALADCGTDGAALPLGALALGLSSFVTGGITVGAGILGRAASRYGARMASLYTVALAGVVATVIGLGLCHAAGGTMPTSLLFNGLIMVICAVIAHNLRKAAE